MNQPSLFDSEPIDDICRDYHGGNRESEEANASIAPSKHAIRERIWRHLVATGGCTSDECEVDLNLSHQTASARLTELVRDKRAYRSFTRRPTRSGRMAAVICAVK